MASTESLGLMLFTIEIMKERLTSSELSPLTLAFTNCLIMPCIASRSATPNAFAMSCSPSSGSGWWIENPCDRSLIRGVAAALVWSVAVIVEVVGSGAVSMLRSLAGARGQRALRPRAGDRWPRWPGAFSIMGGFLGRHRNGRARYGGATGIWRLRNDERMP